MAEKWGNRTENKKNLVRQGLLLAVIFSLLLAIAFGWFVSNQQVTADGVHLQPYSKDVTAQLYELIDNTTTGALDSHWRKVERLVIENYLPGENRTYKIILTNQSRFVEHTSSIQLSGFSLTINKNGIANEPYLELADQITLTQVITDGTVEVRGNTLSASWSEETVERNLMLKNDIQLPVSTAESPGTATVQFTFHFSEDAGNIYQNKILEFEKIDIITS